MVCMGNWLAPGRFKAPVCGLLSLHAEGDPGVGQHWLLRKRPTGLLRSGGLIYSAVFQGG